MILVVPYRALCKYFNRLCSDIVDKRQNVLAENRTQDNSCLLLKLSTVSILFGNQRVFRDEISDDQLGYRILVVPYWALYKYFNRLCSDIVDKKTKCSR